MSGPIVEFDQTGLFGATLNISFGAPANKRRRWRRLWSSFLQTHCVNLTL